MEGWQFKHRGENQEEDEQAPSEHDETRYRDSQAQTGPPHLSGRRLLGCAPAREVISSCARGGRAHRFGVHVVEIEAVAGAGRDERGELQLRDDPENDVPAPEGTPPRVRPIEMPLLVQRLAQSREVYLARVPEAQDSERVRPAYDYNNALLLYYYGYWPQARQRFLRIYNERCSGPLANSTGQVAWESLYNMSVGMGDTAEAERLAPADAAAWRELGQRHGARVVGDPRPVGREVHAGLSHAALAPMCTPPMSGLPSGAFIPLIVTSELRNGSSGCRIGDIS